jgi:hypothetical protein
MAGTSTAAILLPLPSHIEGEGIFGHTPDSQEEIQPDFPNIAGQHKPRPRSRE